MKKIILFIDGLAQGGAQRQLVGLAVMLQEQGLLVEVVTYHDIPFYEKELSTHHICHTYIEKPKSGIKLVWKVRNTLREMKPDVIISYLDTPNIIACLVKMSGIDFKLIVSERNTTQQLTRRERLKFLLYKFADAVVSNSFSQEHFINQYYPFLGRKTLTITNFVNLDIFQPVLQKKTSQTLRIIGVGRVEAQKNIACLIMATQIVIAQGYSIKTDWYGRKTSLVEEYEELLDNLKLRGAFTFYEATLQIVQKYQDADLFCLPSLYEGYPNVLCEAMACGLPVICSDVCDNPIIMAEGVNGFLFNPHDPNDLATQIVRFATSSAEVRKLMGRESRNLAEQKFNKEKYINSYLELIN